MPTGYTAGIEDGTIADFPTFAMTCARAFGATISMRDDPLDVPIPDEFAPSDYHAKAIATATGRLASLKRMTPKEQHAAAVAEHQRDLQSHASTKEDYRLRRERYNAMLLQVMQWEPPTPDHVGLKTFMVEQINQSTRYSTFDYPPPVQKTCAEWFARQLAAAEKEIEYHTEERLKEHERASQRTAWVRSLRESLTAAKV